MAFLIKNDFDQLINSDDLNAITGTDEQVLDDAIASTQIEMESYIRDRYDVDLMFFDVRQYADDIPFNLDSIAVLVGEDFKPSESYQVGEIIHYRIDGNVYRCIQQTTNEPPTDQAFFEIIGQQNKTYKSIFSGTGNNPNDPSFFEIIDNRDPLLVRMFVDMVLYEVHSRINPRNIPEFRIARRDDVINYLKMIADPRNNISPAFPVVDHGENRGVDISFGKTDESKNTY